MFRTVFINPNLLEDSESVRRIVRHLTPPSGRVDVMFFDNRDNTPVRLPMTDQQMLHYCARYSGNSNTGYEEFVLINVLDSAASPPVLQEVATGLTP